MTLIQIAVVDFWSLHYWPPVFGVEIKMFDSETRERIWSCMLASTGNGAVLPGKFSVPYSARQLDIANLRTRLLNVDTMATTIGRSKVLHYRTRNGNLSRRRKPDSCTQGQRRSLASALHPGKCHESAD